MNKLWGQNHNIPWAAQDELYAELLKVSHVATLSPQERAIYDEHLRQYRDNLATLKLLNWMLSEELRAICLPKALTWS